MMLYRFKTPHLPDTAAAIMFQALVIVMMLGSDFNDPSYAAEVSASQEANIPNITGVNVQISQCSRKDGVITIQMVLRNNSGQMAQVTLIKGGNYDDYYFTAKNKKYFILRDAEDKPLASSPGQYSLDVSLKQGNSWTWWAKYPAPPPEVKSITYYTPLTLPFEDLPVTD
jgi:hypothetical protein